MSKLTSNTLNPLPSLPFYADDITVLARALAKQLATFDVASTGPLDRESIDGEPKAMSVKLGNLGHRREASRRKHPSHVEMLNVLARSIGHRNYQHLRASAIALHRMRSQATPPRDIVDVDYTLVERLAQYFDADGRLMRWPKKFSHQVPCMWVIWSRVPPRKIFDENGINEVIKAAHTFRDHATLRRELVNHKLVKRELDCTNYERLERKPPREVVALIRHIGLRKDATRLVRETAQKYQRD